MEDLWVAVIIQKAGETFFYRPTPIFLKCYANKELEIQIPRDQTVLLGIDLEMPKFLQFIRHETFYEEFRKQRLGLFFVNSLTDPVR